MNARTNNAQWMALAVLTLGALVASGAQAGTQNPILILGGSGIDTVEDVTTDGSGNVYVVGETTSADFPIVGGLQRSLAGGTDAFLVKLNPGANTILYSTFLGGTGNDKATGVAVDAAGYVYVAGTTSSVDFPTTAFALDTHCGTDGACDGGRSDIFVTKLTPMMTLYYSTYVGGSGSDETIEERKCIAVDGAGRAIVVGRTNSVDFPTRNALQPSYGGGASDAVVFGLGSRGQALFFSTYLGGSRADTASSIAIGPQGYVIVGQTGSMDFPATDGSSYAGGAYDGFVAVVSPMNFGLGGATLIGGSSVDDAAMVTVDTAGSIWVGGNTYSANLPVHNATQWTIGGGQDIFLAHYDAGLHLLSATYHGGMGDDTICSLRLDPSGRVTVTGKTDSMDFPLVAASQTTFGGGMLDGLMVVWTPAADQVLRSTYIGGALDECVKIVLNAPRPGPAGNQIAIGNWMPSGGGEGPHGAAQAPNGGQQAAAGHGFVAAIF